MLDDEPQTGTLRGIVRQFVQEQVPRDASSSVGLPPRTLSSLLEAVAARPQIWEPCVRHEESCRWYGSLFRDDVVDLWLLTWQQDNSTDLHDHGGSCGAFRVVSGVLTEFRPMLAADGVRLGQHGRRVGETVAFGPRLVHDVHNIELEPAVSLHVYSPPLTSMTYYEVTGERLTRRHTEPVEVRSSEGLVPERALTVDA